MRERPVDSEVWCGRVGEYVFRFCIKEGTTCYNCPSNKVRSVAQLPSVPPLLECLGCGTINHATKFRE